MIPKEGEKEAGGFRMHLQGMNMFGKEMTPPGRGRSLQGR